jgi:hypothetical protein
MLLYEVFLKLYDRFGNAFSKPNYFEEEIMSGINSWKLSKSGSRVVAGIKE